MRGTTVACLIADGGDFRSRPVDGLDLDFGGIAGDIHAGAMRKAGSREPWYPRGTPIRNNRQITLVGSEELAAVAAGMELPEIAPGWIGANLVTEGVPDVTRLPIGTRLIFSGAAVLFVEGENAPCRIAGRS
ncbi:MAG: MOSC domain-containing protein, partial [Rhizobiales bacterium]|nr:MOSC domain-containing protein [Hyphomicrobiales bacterium]